MTRPRALLIAVVGAIVVRWLFCFWIFPSFLAARSTVGTTYYFDSYREIASSMWSGAGYRLGPGGPPALHRPPVYAAFLMLANPRDERHSYLWLHLLQGLLGGAAVLATYRAARRWNVGSRGALFAAWLVALWPFAIWETKVSVPENLLLVLMPLAFSLVPDAGASLVKAALLGLVGAALALTHPLYQVVIVPLLIRQRRMLAIVATVVAFAVPLSLWIARNARLGYPGVATGFGFHYFKGEYELDQLSEGKPYFRDNDIPAGQSVDGILRRAAMPPIDTNEERSDPRINRFLDRLAVRDLEARPGHTLLKVVIKMPLAWVQQQSPARSVVTLLLLIPLFLLAIRGLRRQPSLWPIAFAVIFLNAAAALVFVEAIPMRYALPWMPLMAILAGAGVSRIDRKRGDENGLVDERRSRAADVDLDTVTPL